MWVDTGDVIVARAAWTSCVEGLVHPSFFSLALVLAGRLSVALRLT